MKNAMFISILLLACLLSGCGDTDPSSSIPTDGIYARFVAETRADGTSEVRADFFEEEKTVGPFVYYYEGVYLDGGDTLEVSTHENRLLFTGGGDHFAGELVTGIAADTQFQFDLQRPEYVDAPDSWGTLPEPMDLVVPEPNQEYSIANDDLALVWTTGGTLDDMWVRVEADCLEPNRPEDWYLDESFSVDIPSDPGAYTEDLSDHFIHADECQRYAATVTLYRARAGTLDPAYKPKDEACEDNDSEDCEQKGYVSIRQVRSVPIALRP